MYKYVKRLFDILFGLIGLIVLIPLSIGAKVVLLLTGKNTKIFYRQRRIGKDGKVIRIFKFRSMVLNAEEMLEELLKEERYQKEWGENQKFEDDPRITKFGRYLRKTSLDELPQLINVLLGDMSLVGPRPLVEGELEAHGGSPLYWKVKPGITGWWASHGRSDIGYDERLEMEYYYIRNLSFKLDCICIFKTIASVLTAKGAK